MSSAKPPTKPASRIIAISLVVVGVCGFFLWQRSQGPRYQGKTMREWLDAVTPNPASSATGRGQFYSLNDQTGLLAMLNILGSNAAPILIDIFEQADSRITKLKTAALRSRRLPDSVNSGMSADLNAAFRTLALAGSAIQHLGSNAFHIIPDLERITCDPERKLAGYPAANALAGFGLQAMPNLQRSLINAPADRQPRIRELIDNIYRKGLSSDDPEVREASALAMSESPQPPFEIVPILLDTLESPELERRRKALNALAHHLPVLAPSLVNGYHAVKKQTTTGDAEMCRVAIELLRKLPQPDPDRKP